MSDYFNAGMRLYLDHLVDWRRLLALRGRDAADVEAEVGAYRTLLETAAKLAESFEDDAREHWAAEAELTAGGGAQSPPHMRAAYQRLRETGLVALTVSEQWGGYGLPALVNGIFLEMISRADPSLMMVLGLQTGVASDIERYGDDAIRRAYLPRFISGEIQGCMDLTEAQAGSDLGGIVTRATDLPDGRVQVDGQKIYISNGGAEVHLVLARDAAGFEQSRGTTQGLSLVLVPRHLEDGSRNGVRVARLERKMGIHGSATCEVVFERAIGHRLGAAGQGFRAMLDLMNAARLGVASQALGLCEAALHDAASYAREREQFGKPIAEQPMVMAMLASMLIETEAVRALLYRTYRLLDLDLAREAALAQAKLPADRAAAMRADLERDTARVRLLTPLCKYFATETCDRITRNAMQVFGGIGFTMDADVAKLHADSLIMTVYEGTSEIQASFALREIGKGGLAVVFSEIRAELASMAEDPLRARLAKRVEGMADRVEQSIAVLFSDISYALLRAKLLTEMVIDVIASTELLQQVDADPDRLDIAEGYIASHAVKAEYLSQRIEENADGLLERDARLVARLTAQSS
ncbi:MAG TPA: acyl-CoA dehydrogenase family protein [Myxococcota bacterium]|nr:acyl-CoA dehydrogenase family protein [Myxococcota bacterium]